MGTGTIAVNNFQARSILDRDYIDPWNFLFACRVFPIASNNAAAEARLRSPPKTFRRARFWMPSLSALNNSGHLPKTPDLEEERSAMGTTEIVFKIAQARKNSGPR